MKKTTNPILNVLGSYNLCVFLLAGLFLTTYLGTVGSARIGLYAAGKMYFESFYFIEKVGPISVPLPGAVGLMILLAVNLFFGGFVRIRKNKRTVGILIVHFGIAGLMGSGLVRMVTATESHVTLYEQEQANVAVSYNKWEVAVVEVQGDSSKNEWAAPDSAISAMTGDSVRVISGDGLPFDVHLQHFVPNARVMPKGPNWSTDFPVVDGYAVQKNTPSKEASRNTAAIFASVVPKGASIGTDGAMGILYSQDRAPYVIDWEGKVFSIQLRRERYPLPFQVELVKFTKSDHPGMSMAAGFSSDILTIEDGEETPVHIKMNEPLRDSGLVFYQSSWGPEGAPPGTPLFSTLSVVENPSDKWPEFFTWVITFGMAIAFLQRLMAYLSKQAQRRSSEQGNS